MKKKNPTSKAHTHFRLGDVAQSQLDEITPTHLSFRARIELAINMAWTLYKNQQKWMEK
jgi:hypothetical protein